MAAGAPPLMQITTTDPSPESYFYLWMRPVKLDAEGRAVAINGGRVQCEPPPSTSPPDPDPGKTLYAGLAPTHDDHADCTADSLAALRGAAKSTEMDDSEDVLQAHWVRDGSQ
jgi:hypothetical protein